MCETICRYLDQVQSLCQPWPNIIQQELALPDGALLSTVNFDIWVSMLTVHTVSATVLMYMTLCFTCFGLYSDCMQVLMFCQTVICKPVHTYTRWQCCCKVVFHLQFSSTRRHSLKFIGNTLGDCFQSTFRESIFEAQKMFTRLHM